MTSPAERAPRAEGHLWSSPEAGWAVLGDLRRMPDLSPERVGLIGLKPVGLRPGEWYVGVSGGGWVVWPARSTVTGVEPGRLLAWDTASGGARWIWELVAEGEGTLVVHRRP